MDDYTEQMLKHVGLLAKLRIEQKGFSPRKFATAAGMADQTVNKFIAGKRRPNAETRQKFEEALSWKRGILTDVFDGAEHGLRPDSVDMEFLDAVNPVRPVPRADALSDAELLAEVIGRLQGWAARLGDDPVKVESADNEAFDLAARALKGIKDDDAP